MTRPVMDRWHDGQVTWWELIFMEALLPGRCFSLETFSLSLFAVYGLWIWFVLSFLWHCDFLLLLFCFDLTETSSHVVEADEDLNKESSSPPSDLSLTHQFNSGQEAETRTARGFHMNSSQRAPVVEVRGQANASVNWQWAEMALTVQWPAGETSASADPDVAAERTTLHINNQDTGKGQVTWRRGRAAAGWTKTE